MLLLYVSGAVNNLIDVFIEFMNKESVLYISIMEYISDAWSDMKMNTDIRVETIHSTSSQWYGNIKAFRG